MSWIEKYVEYVEEFSDSPPVFHHRVGLSLLSTIVNRNVWIVSGHRHFYPNLWMILVAKSGFYRKSSSIEAGEYILRQVNPSLRMPSEFSHEKFVEMLALNPKGILIFYEFRRLMGMLSKDYMAGFQSMLTELYDCPSSYERKTKAGEHIVTEPFLNILAASTVNWLQNSLNENDIAGGFLPRFLIVTCPEKDKIIPFQPPASASKRNMLIEGLKEISTLTGEMVFNDKARSYYSDWYIAFERKHDKESELLNPFHVRLTDYAKKLSMLSAIDKRMSLFINEEDVREACALADSFSRELDHILENDIVLTAKNKDKKKVEIAIRKAYPDWLPRKNLLRATRLQAKDLDQIIQTLKQEERIEEVVLNNDTLHGAASSRVQYRWTHDE